MAHIVTIVGAGPAGLLLARYLQLHHIQCVIYEADNSPTSRNQGGTLDLHEETGLMALRETGLLESARGKMQGAEAEAMKIMDAQGKVWYDENEEASSSGESKGRPEIDRSDLRDILLDSLEEGTVRWAHKITDISATNDDNYEITFQSQPTITTSILVGADGAFSRVRPLLHSTSPTYTGLTMYDLQIAPADLPPDLVSFIGKGTCMILQDGKGLIPQMNSGGRCRVYAAVYSTDGTRMDLPTNGKKEIIKRMYTGWDRRCADLIMASQEESIVARRIYAYSPDLTWTSELYGVTIIGDAAHVMAPSGEGVNMALHDALLLGQALVPLLSASDLDRAALRSTLRDFERDMMLRAKDEMETSEQMLRVCYGPRGGAEAFTEMMQTLMAGGEAGGPPQ